MPWEVGLRNKTTLRLGISFPVEFTEIKHEKVHTNLLVEHYIALYCRSLLGKVCGGMVLVTLGFSLEYH